MCAFVKLFLLYSCCVFISLWTSLSTRYFVCMTLYTLLTLVPFIGSQLQCTQSIALTYHLINYLGTETWLREWYYNFWWDKVGVSHLWIYWELCLQRQVNPLFHQQLLEWLVRKVCVFKKCISVTMKTTLT